MNEDFACLPIFLKQFPHLLLSDVRRKIAHKEPTTLGEGLLSWFPKILQVNSQAFILAAGLLPICRHWWRWWLLLLLLVVLLMVMLMMLPWSVVLFLQVKSFIALHLCTLKINLTDCFLLRVTATLHGLYRPRKKPYRTLELAILSV